MNFTNLLTFAEEQRIALTNHTALMRNHHPHRRKRYSTCSNRLNKGREQRHQEPFHEQESSVHDVEHHRALERIESYGDAEHEFSMSQYKSSSSRSLGSSSLSRTPSIPIAIEKCPSEPIIIARVDEYDEGTRELERYFELKTNRMQERRRRSCQPRQGLPNAEWLVEENTRSTFFLNHEVLALDD